MQYKKCWANERSPQKVSNRPDPPLVGRNADKQVVLTAWCDTQIHKLPSSILKNDTTAIFRSES